MPVPADGTRAGSNAQVTASQLRCHAVMCDLMRADMCQVASLPEENSLQTRCQLASLPEETSLQTRCQLDRRAGHLFRSTRSSTMAMLILEMPRCGMMAWRWKDHTLTRKMGESPALSSEHVPRRLCSRAREHGIPCSGTFWMCHAIFRLLKWTLRKGLPGVCSKAGCIPAADVTAIGCICSKENQSGS